jgi:GMP synthase (glutamine-hydrolysing)
MKKLLIIKAGTTYPAIRKEAGDFDDMIIERAGLERNEVTVCPVYEGRQLPEPDNIYAAIITGSHDMVTDRAAWSLYLEAWVRETAFNRIPVLGICYSHQLIAQALGGEAGYHPGGLEFGTVTVGLTEAGKANPLMRGLPAMFPVHVAHAQTVTKLPPGAMVLANNQFEPHHSIAFGHNIWGLQFHPEYTVDIIHRYIDEAKRGLEKKGYDIQSLHSAVAETPCGQIILKRFIELAQA